MLTKMTDADWITVLRVFEASRSRRGDKARDDKNSYQQCAEQFGRGRGAGREPGFPVYFQLKATTRWNDNAEVVYDLESKTYNALVSRDREAIPCILILLCFPKSRAIGWMDQKIT
jgi:hypothetical protein